MRHFAATCTLLLATGAAAQPDVVTASFRCNAGVAEVEIVFFLAPPDAIGAELVREITIGSCDGPVALTADPIAPPGDWSEAHHVVVDTELTGDFMALYVLKFIESDGRRREADRFWGQCGSPILARGWLPDANTFVPCDDVCLLACTGVEIAYVDLLQYVGTGEVLELRGFPIFFTDPQDCAISVDGIVPLPAGATCADSSPAARTSWSALKSLYR